MGGRGAGSHGGRRAAEAEVVSDEVREFVDGWRERIGVIPVSDNARELSEDEIIEKISGLDMTGGSCVSLAIAYAANKAGLDVEDYRGGESQRAFALVGKGALRRIVGTENFTSSFEKTRKAKWNLIESTVEPGQEYIVTAGGAKYGHAAVVRKIGSSYQYLELQTSSQNGWESLSMDEFGRRFNVPKRSKYETSVTVTPVSAMVENKESLRAIASLLNTAG